MDDSFLKKIGIEPVINAWGTVTLLGGNTLGANVLEGYRELSNVFVDMIKFTEAANSYISRLIGVEAAMIVPGAASGIVISVASLMSEGDLVKASGLPCDESLKNEILMLKNHENAYQYLAQIPGAKIIEIGDENGITETELVKSVSNKTAAFLYFDFAPIKTGLSIEGIIKIMHEHSVPVIVDAAAELPPISNLKRYYEKGADISIFSGGKDIGGPNNTGMILGKSNFIGNCKVIGPLIYKDLGNGRRTFIGRPMKMTKEDIAAFTIALEKYLETDHTSRIETLKNRMNALGDKLKLKVPGIKVRLVTQETGDTVRPLVIPKLGVDTITIGLKPLDVVERLKNLNPPVYCYSLKNEVMINPQCLRPEEDDMVLDALLQILV